MKKILLLFLATTVILPSFAVCKIGEICSANNNPKIQKQIIKKEQNKKTNLKDGTQSNQPFINTTQNLNYDANCQFGICLPKYPKTKK